MLRARYFAPLAVLLAALVCLSGCAGVVKHPNQINATDGAMYDSLIMLQASLGRASQEISAAPATLGKFKPQFNQAVEAYNTAQAAYKLYHAQASGAPDVKNLQAQIDALVASVSQLLTALGVHP